MFPSDFLLPLLGSPAVRCATAGINFSPRNINKTKKPYISVRLSEAPSAGLEPATL